MKNKLFQVTLTQKRSQRAAGEHMDCFVVVADTEDEVQARIGGQVRYREAFVDRQPVTVSIQEVKEGHYLRGNLMLCKEEDLPRCPSEDNGDVKEPVESRTLLAVYEAAKIAGLPRGQVSELASEMFSHLPEELTEREARALLVHLSGTPVDPF